MLGLAAVPAIIQGILMLFMPESQRWLAKKDRNIEATQTLKLIYPRDVAEEEFFVL